MIVCDLLVSTGGTGLTTIVKVYVALKPLLSVTETHVGVEFATDGVPVITELVIPVVNDIPAGSVP